jgi:hypothetical protein
MAGSPHIQASVQGWRYACLAAALLPLLSPAAAREVVYRPGACAKHVPAKAPAGCARRRKFDGQEPLIVQISPAIRRARAFYLHEPREPTTPPRTGHGDLIDALQVPPNPATIPVLRAYNIPIIPDLPPIVIIRPRPTIIDTDDPGP